MPPAVPKRPQGMKVRRDGTPEVTAARRLGQTQREANDQHPRDQLSKGVGPQRWGLAVRGKLGALREGPSTKRQAGGPRAGPQHTEVWVLGLGPGAPALRGKLGALGRAPALRGKLGALGNGAPAIRGMGLRVGPWGPNIKRQAGGP